MPIDPFHVLFEKIYIQFLCQFFNQVIFLFACLTIELCKLLYIFNLLSYQIYDLQMFLPFYGLLFSFHLIVYFVMQRHFSLM